MKTRIAAMLFIALGITAGAARAASVPWDEAGHLVVPYGGGVFGTAITEMEHPGDEFYLFSTGFGDAGSRQENVQHVGADGVPSWSLPTFLQINGQSGMYTDGQMALDGAGGLFAVGNGLTDNSNVILQHVNAAGESDWGAPLYENGMKAVVLESTESGYTSQSVAADGAGGVWVAWTGISPSFPIRLQHLLADGSIAPGWNRAGRTVAATGDACHVVADGIGGAIVTWFDSQNEYAQRIQSDTTVAAGWPAAGLLLGSRAPAFYGYREPNGLLSTGDGHFLAIWTSPAANAYTPPPYSAQRFGLNGTIDAGWPAGGLVVATNAHIAWTQFLADPQGGLLVVWLEIDTGRLLWSHVRADGSFAPNHSAAGLSPLDPGASFARSPGGSKPRFAAANSHDDGIVIAWDDNRATSAYGIRVRWLLADGTPDPTEPDTARLIPRPYAPTPSVLGAVSDRAGGVFLAFGTLVPSGNRTDIWMNHMARTGAALGVTPVAPRTSLALSAPQPNPARTRIGVRCTLAGDRPATLALYDVLGRLRQRVTLAGAGEHAAVLDGLDREAPGVYLLRLAQGGEQRVARVAIVR